MYILFILWCATSGCIVGGLARNPVSFWVLITLLAAMNTFFGLLLLKEGMI